ncbi:hypothetical protein BV898_06450 [Hypsibius exemplaris]|uniref:Tautomerase cis-CaaD-like domain-containing protein n=1 Tax=Hypsibius exemplaris TaxID=2072580 RepID=A0A1W0WW87_HYPEX|nr:hypothetical protein BV898_06450 [Hypsibius exemplaris]
MPLHRIFHNPETFSPTAKEGLASTITNIYTDRGLPPFYAVVLFLPLETDLFFVGGKATDQFVRFVVQHLARPTWR